MLVQEPHQYRLHSRYYSIKPDTIEGLNGFITPRRCLAQKGFDSRLDLLNIRRANLRTLAMEINRQKFTQIFQSHGQELDGIVMSLRMRLHFVRVKASAVRP